MKQTFEKAFCEHFGVESPDFPRLLLLKSCSWYMRPIVRGLFKVFPNCFKEDMVQFNCLRSVESGQMFRVEVNAIHDYHRHGLPTWRRLFRVRASGQKLARFAKLMRNSRED